MLNKNLEFFKHFEDENYYKLKKIDYSDIENFENKYDVKLPNDYKEFMLEFNGCSLELSFNKNEEVYFLDNNLINPSIDYYLDLKDIEEIIDENFYFDYQAVILPKKIIPMATSGSASSELGIGVGEENNGKIYLWQLDDSGITPYIVSESFSELISAYFPIKESDIVDE